MKISEIFDDKVMPLAAEAELRKAAEKRAKSKENEPEVARDSDTKSVIDGSKNDVKSAT